MVDLQRIYRRVHRAEGRRKGICHSEEQCKEHLPLVTPGGVSAVVHSGPGRLEAFVGGPLKGCGRNLGSTYS